MKFRTAAVQYMLADISSFEQFAEQVTHYVRNASEYGVQFILFPEFLTTQLLSIGDEAGQALTIDRLPDFTEDYLKLFRSLASEYSVYIVGEPTSSKLRTEACETRRISFIQMAKSMFNIKFILPLLR